MPIIIIIVVIILFLVLCGLRIDADGWNETFSRCGCREQTNIVFDENKHTIVEINDVVSAKSFVEYSDELKFKLE